MPARPRYVIAFYEIDRVYGGPEEGGWWFDTGDLRRPLKVVRTEREADSVAARANRLLDRFQRHTRSPSSMAYASGRFAACVFGDTAPRHFPATRPHYE